ncbi:Thioredoxin-like 1-2, chloroplastic-like protein [Drosera capensis]
MDSPSLGLFPVLGSRICVQTHIKGFGLLKLKSSSKLIVKAQATICVSKAQRWWEKTLKPNMMEINSAQELVDSVRNAGDRLVIVGFYSPGCGGCRSLHPKLAEANPGALFLQVNHENLQPMCHALHVHVLPFFRFYRGAEGRVCSFNVLPIKIRKSFRESKTRTVLLHQRDSHQQTDHHTPNVF